MLSTLSACLAFAGEAPPTTMRAFVRLSATEQRAVDSQPVPAVGDLHKKYSELPASCEVLIKVAASSVNPSDIHPTVASSMLPHVLGSDVSGVVAQAGEDCQRLKVGDRVFGDIGANAHAKVPLHPKTKELGGYAEWAVALESQLGVVPASIGLAEAAALPKVALTSYKALVWYTGARNKSDTPWTRPGGPVVLVLGGSGGCGTTGLQLATHFGAASLITTTSKDNFDYCRGLGATRLIDYQSTNWWDVLPKDSVDVVYDTVGQAGTGDRAMAVLRSGGRHS
jgi:NADPH:quinone reductase-like Zn-dependent oxidoreductase|eukprot:Transcript_10417.p1 GENE.Transcript_10417~~Transcript_10417.p1  ORF type:complete len:282 (+),score=90.82 Transcript_10417:173-1018(+)